MTNQISSTDNKTQVSIGPRTMPPPDGASDVLRDAIGSNPELVLERLKQLGVDLDGAVLVQDDHHSQDRFIESH